MTATTATRAFTFDDGEADLDDRGAPAALYFRSSKGKAASIADQRAAGARRAERSAWNVVARELDKISASSHEARERDGWPRLVELVEARAIRVVWLWESSRGDRTRSSWMQFLELCARRNVLIYVECDHYLYDPRRVRDMRNLAEDGNDSAYESDKIHQRTMRAKNEARRDGNLRRVYGGTPPLGLRNGETDWETEPRLAAILRATAADYLADPDHSLAAAFAANVPAGTTDDLGRPVTIKIMRAALRRPATAGLMVGRDDEPLGYESCIAGPPLDAATWRRVRAIFASRFRTGRPTIAGRYTFGPLLRCDGCGNQLSGSAEHGADRYRCANPHKRLGVLRPCRGVSIRAEDAHAVIRAAVEAWAEVHPDYLAAAATQPATDSREAELVSLRDRALDEYGDLTANRRFMKPGRFDAMRADLQAEIGAYEAELGEVAEVAQNVLPADVDWASMSEAEARALVAEALVTPIIVKAGRGGSGAPSALDRMLVEVRP